MASHDQRRSTAHLQPDALSRLMLEQYGLHEARLTLVREGDNSVFRVDVPSGERFALRVHTANRHTAAMLASELDWLDVLGRAHLPVPQPVRSTSGSCVATLPSDSAALVLCTLLTWLEGEPLPEGKELTEDQAEHAGRLLARLHLQAEQFSAPPSFERPEYDAALFLASGQHLRQRLSTSYYLRSAGAYDTLLQMGRWFGYRSGYLDLCRIHTTTDLIERYAHVTLASEELRQQLEAMADRGMTPEDFGLRVRTHTALTITARNKMRSGTALVLSYADSLSEQVTFDRSSEATANNLRAVEELLARAGTPQRNGEAGDLIWREVPHTAVQHLLASYSVPKASYKMVPGVLSRYINQRVADNLGC